ncbi:hypothetical protein ANN_17877 [Periplaneta americana]|uniref:DUF4817 domain-containing protein n=1 Tax=Periplaneta americana TaxID=6978 RepID=A0ABQ8SVP5_PERAM|nr:hypothetical protein ANN_17877 [Periplaneta americana]
MVRYSFQEQAEMVFVYGQTAGNGREAARMHRATYPDRQHHPHHTTFGAIFWRLCEHGSFETDERAGRPHTVRTPDVEEHVLHDSENNPGTSSRQVLDGFHLLGHTRTPSRLIPGMNTGPLCFYVA